MKKIVMILCLVTIFAILPTASVSASDDTISNATLKSIDTSIYGYLSSNDLDWFKFETNNGGYFDIYTTGTTDTYAKLYDRDSYRCGFLWLSTCYTDNLLQSDNYWKDYGTNLNFYFNRTFDSNHDYYLRVSGNNGDTGSYYLHVNRHLDSKENPEGGRWTPNTAYGDPDGSMMGVSNKVYLDQEGVRAYHIIMNELERNSNTTLEEIGEILADEAISLSLGVYGPIYSVLKGLLDVFLPTPFEMFMDDLVETSGLTINPYSNTVNVQNKVEITNSYVDVFTCSYSGYYSYCYYTRIDVKTVDVWNSNYMEGELGYKGAYVDFD